MRERLRSWWSRWARRVPGRSGLLPAGDDGASRAGPRAAGGGASPQNGSPAVETDDVTVRLGEATILAGVSASIDRGTFVGLVGPNGAGKTTLLRTVTGTLTPASGTVRVGGDDVHELGSRAASRRAAAVPQDTSVAFDFDVRDIVAMGRTPYASRLGCDEAGTEAVDRALARTGIERFADRPVGEVSGGERQRVLLARALAQDAPVLVLDEPTASLDVNHQVRTLELVRELVADGKTAIAAIHDLDLAARYCDELLLLREGRIAAAGAPESVLTEANVEATFGTRIAVARHPVTGSATVTALPDSVGDSRGRVHVVGAGEDAAETLYRLVAAGFEVTVGALGANDIALAAARALGVEAVTVDPFAPVDGEAPEAVECLVDATDVTVVADADVSAGDLPSVEAALRAERLVVVDGDERGDADPRVLTARERLRERGVVVGVDGVVEAVTDRSPGGVRVEPDGG